MLRKLFTATDEANWIIAELIRYTSLTTKEVLTFSDFVILLRTASLSLPIETALGKQGIPYRMVGGKKFYDRAEIKILLDYMRVICHPSHNEALARIINQPRRSIGDQTVKVLHQEAVTAQQTLWEHIQDRVQGRKAFRTKLSRAADTGLTKFFDIIESAREKLANSQGAFSICKLLDFIVARLEFRVHLKKEYPEDIEEVRWANVDELRAQATEIDNELEKSQYDINGLPELPDVEQRTTGSPLEEALSNFLSNVTLEKELDNKRVTSEEEQSQPKVTISTIHAAKGLEWPVVFIPSVYQGSIPHSRAEDHDEERRLLYVAMTRAKALLNLSCPTRNSWKDGTEISHFLTDEKVVSCLDKQGPSLHANMVWDLCEIL